MKSNHPIRILIADDHSAVREGLVAIIERRSNFLVVAQACNGMEAVDLYREFRPDITLMDMRMPQMDGLTATQAILVDFPEARVILMTAFPGEEENSLRAGAVAVMLKGAPRDDILNAIQAAYEAPST